MNIISALMITLTLLVFNSCKDPIDPNPGQVISHEQLNEGHKVCFMGDSGKGTSKQDLVGEVLAKEGCDQVRHLGDIIYPHGISDADDINFIERFYTPYKKMLDAKIPFYMSVGNHDYRKNPSAWIQLAEKYDTIKFPSMYFLDVYNDICFITLDTNSRFNEQEQWLSILKEKYMSKCKLTFVSGHHPLYSSGSHGDATGSTKDFLQNNVEGKFDAYFAGHEHNQEDYGHVQNTKFLVTGGAAEYRTVKNPPLWAQAALGYMIMTIHYQDGRPHAKYYFYSIDENTGAKKLEHYGVLIGRGFR